MPTAARRYRPSASRPLFRKSAKPKMPGTHAIRSASRLLTRKTAAGGTGLRASTSSARHDWTSRSGERFSERLVGTSWMLSTPAPLPVAAV